MADGTREVPPTAGLPLRWRDFLIRPDRSLEASFAATLHLSTIQIECSGTAALIVALTSLKRDSSRRSVIIPAYTCPLVVLAIAYCGLKPVLCDLRIGHFDMSLPSLSGLCNDDTLAVVPTHLGGRIADVPGVISIAARVGAAVIEDAAQALGATWQGKPVGTLGDVAFYSLAVGKGLTLYEGGVLMAREEGLRRLLRETGEKLSPYRLGIEIRRLAQLAGYTALYRPLGLYLAYGVPLRRALRRGKIIQAVGDDFSAAIPLHRVGAWRRAIGANALMRFQAFLRTCSEQAAVRKERLAAIPGIKVMDDPHGGKGVWPYFMVLMPTAEARDKALTRLWPAGLGVSRLFIHALPDYAYLSAHIGHAEVHNARDFAARMLTISNSPWLGEPDFQRICAVLYDCIQFNRTAAK
jgi:perosamine synthetase